MLESINVNFVIAIVIAYLLGSISPSTILAKMQGIDIKKEGSGNAGATNTLRVLGKKAAIITLIVDVGKGVLAVSLAELIAGPDAAYWAALAALAGHVWPIFFKFRGGKGVAVAFGTILRLDWRIALMMFGLLVIVVAITKIVSIGSLSVCVAFPICCWFMHRELFPVSIAMALVVAWKHSDNIKRLINHDENEVDIGKLLHGKK